MPERCMLCTISNKSRIPVHICGQHCPHFPGCGNTDSLAGCGLSNCYFTTDPEDFEDPCFEGGDLGDYGTSSKHEQRIDGEYALKEERKRNARARYVEERKGQPPNKKPEPKTTKKARERERKESRKEKEEVNRQQW